MMEKISMVIPCYNEEECIEIFYNEMEEIIKQLDCDLEYIFVNDGSVDSSLNIIKHLNSMDSKVKYISFSRNFGKEAAILAGLEAASGDYVGLMDVDLQDPPALVLDMYQGIKEGYDCVGSRRITRKGEPKMRSFFARMFYKIINRISDTHIIDGARDFRLMKRNVVQAILDMKEVDRFSKGIFGYVGFNIKWIEYENVDRVAGNTKWSFKALFRYAIDGIEDFSSFPLAFNRFMAIISFVASLSILITIIVFATLNKNISLLLSLSAVLLFMFSLLFTGLAIQSAYIKKIYRQSKNRPIYIIKEAKLK